MSELEYPGEAYKKERLEYPGLDERGKHSRSRSRSPSLGHEHSEHKYRSRSRSRDLICREDENPGDNLFITGLTIRTSGADLEDIFNKFGRVIKAEIMFDPHTRESRGFGFIRMANAEDADRALTNISNTEIDGRTVTVEKAKRSKPRMPTPGRYYGPPKRGPPRDRRDGRPPRGGDPRYDRYYERSYIDRYEPPRYDRYERDRFDRYDRIDRFDRYDRYDRFDRYDRYDRRPPPPRYDPYPPRPRSPY